VQCPPPRQGTRPVAPLAGLGRGLWGRPLPSMTGPFSKRAHIICNLEAAARLGAVCLLCAVAFSVSSFPMRYIWSRPSSAAFVSPFRTLASCSSRPRPCTRATPPPSSIPFPHLIRRKKTSPFSTSAHPEEAMTVDTSSRLAALRSLMKERNVDIYGTDPDPELPPSPSPPRVNTPSAGR
jgi:hypothetical protein